MLLRALLLRRVKETSSGGNCRINGRPLPDVEQNSKGRSKETANSCPYWGGRDTTGVMLEAASPWVGEEKGWGLGDPPHHPLLPTSLQVLAGWSWRRGAGAGGDSRPLHPCCGAGMMRAGAFRGRGAAARMSEHFFRQGKWGGTGGSRHLKCQGLKGVTINICN